MSNANTNNDLVWDIDAFQQRQRAVDFVLGFENKLCVYSGSVRQLYTNYNIFFPRDQYHRLVILPNPYAHHDTINDIPESAVTPTGMTIIPGLFKNRPTLFLRIPFKTGQVKFRDIPLQLGIKVVQQQCVPSNPFLPVLMKGDLRELDANTPCLHLHRIQIAKLIEHSELDRKSIQKVILKRLGELAAVMA